jgi:fluoroquinolone transport system permease protein
MRAYSKRLFHTTLQDIRFQFRYGFYFLYAVLTVIYIAAISLLPAAWVQNAVAIVLFSDPAALGFFFMGGILLLEKGERLHDALFVSPLTISGYVLSKAVSLGLVSMLAGLLIAAFCAGSNINYPMLALSLLAGSVLFTFAGIITGTAAKTVNHYMILSIPAEILLNIPPILLLFGVDSPVLEFLPGSVVLRLLQWSSGLSIPYPPFLLLILLTLWEIPVYFLVLKRMRKFVAKIGGGA